MSNLQEKGVRLGDVVAGNKRKKQGKKRKENAGLLWPGGLVSAQRKEKEEKQSVWFVSWV